MTTSVSELKPDIEAIKTKLKATWTAGDFGQIALFTAPEAENFIDRLALTPGIRVLDVACGNGNLSIPAARAGALVTGIDIVPNLLEQARNRADFEGLKIKFDEGDAEKLPYADKSFDSVVTMFGAMFAPRPDKAAAELIRVCRSGGQVAMANWTPTGFIGQMFKTTAAHVAPPQDIPSPLLWGKEDTVRERLNSGIKELQLTRRLLSFKFPFPPPEVVEYFRVYYGPTNRAFAALDITGQAELCRDLEKVWAEHNRATDGTTEVDSEYLEVIATVN